MALLDLLTGVLHLREMWPKINSNFNALNADIATEATNRTNADNAVNARIDAEVTNRAAADNALDERIDNLVVGAGTAGPNSAEIVDARQPVSGSAYPTLGDRLNDSDTQAAAHLADFAQSVYKNRMKLISMLENGQVTKIKIVADSFGVGVGSTGGAAGTSGNLIGTTGVYEALTATTCWVNYFRNHITRKYPAVSFFNASIGGYSIKSQGLSLGTGWYGADNDVIIVMLGANDRDEATSEADFKTYATQFLANVKATCNYMLVCSQNNPLDEFDSSGNLKNGYILSMEQIDKILAEICKEQDYTFVSVYKELKSFCEARGVFPKSLVRTLKDGYTDDLHPNDRGHLAIWEILQKCLGIFEDTYLMNSKTYYSSPKIVEDVYTLGDITKLLSTYSLGVTYQPVANASAVTDNLPGASNSYSGMLTTYKFLSEALSYQEYRTSLGNFVAHRDWITGTTWSAWIIYDNCMSDKSRYWKTVSGATPVLDTNTHAIVSNASATNMTNMSTYSPYAIVTLTFANGNTTLKQGSFKLVGGVDWTPTIMSSITFLKTDLTSAWVEMSRTQI